MYATYGNCYQNWLFSGENVWFTRGSMEAILDFDRETLIRWPPERLSGLS